MFRSIATAFAAILGMALWLGVVDAFGQPKSLRDQLIGAWTLVSADQISPDGKKDQTLGPNPKGVVIFDSSGHFAQVFARPGRAKFKANSKLRGTADENAAAVRGTAAYFGTWSIDEGSKTLLLRIVGSMYPNQDGTEQRRTVSVTGDELTIIIPTTASGMKSTNVLRRAK
jgi:hypothetical protein